MASEFVLIPFGSEFVALNREQLEAARERARELLPPSPAPAGKTVEPLIDAKQLAVALSAPQSQVEALARQGRIPSVMVGKYRRFDRAAVLAALAHTGGPGPNR